MNVQYLWQYMSRGNDFPWGLAILYFIRSHLGV